MPSRCSASAFLRKIARRGLELRRLDIGDEAPLEAAPRAVFNRCNRLRRPVGRDDDLPAPSVQVVERVEEFFLELFRALEELDVVDQENVDLAVSTLERRHSLRAHRIHELVHHRFRRNVTHAFTRKQRANMVPNCVKEVGLSETGRAVDEQRVVRPGRALGDRERRRVCEPVGRADDELVERVTRVQLRGRPRRGRVVLDRSGGSSTTGAGAGIGKSEGSSAIVGTRGGADDQLDRVRNPRQGLDRIGQEPEIARADALDRDRARDTEQQCLISAVEGVDALEPRVPRRFGQLGPNCRRDLGPQVICRWSTQGRSPICKPVVHRNVHTCGETAPTRREALSSASGARRCGPRRGKFPTVGAVRAAGGAAT